ncbi:DUF1573 domain-containing protein [uncultured Bacteroides sp.]|uniref:DUF1573 domain-containing protein n=1 Tax=uncultured Bacteroides sp. TaxID=162156 RepID=UPI0025FF06F9|nr:DUF1573 domain-containing protein [uncultured Bacteroides sp.]
MKRLHLLIIVALLAGAGLFGVAHAQNSPASLQARRDSLLNPALLKQAERLLRFDKTVQDVGTLTEDDAPATRRFVCTNVSNRPLLLKRATPTCSCVTVEMPGGELLPGKQQPVTLTFHPKNHPGTIDTQVFVYLSSSDKTPVARLTLTGNVLPGKDEWARYPHAMGRLRLKQNAMAFGEVKAGGRFTERILCGNSSSKPMRLTAPILPAYASFRTEPAVIPPGGEADIVVTIDASLIPAGAKAEFTFPIIIEGISARPSDRTLNIKVKRINP